VVLLHAALKLRVIAEAARLVLGNVGGVRLERVGVEPVTRISCWL